MYIARARLIHYARFYKGPHRVTADALQAYAFGLSDVGKRRERNEDCFKIIPDLHLFLVADGMGGHAGGATASKLAVETIENIVREHRHVLDAQMGEESSTASNMAANLLSDAMRGACHRVYLESMADVSLHGMGTTATALLVHGDHAYVAHVGDSRCYLLRNNEILQLTEDHSLVNEQMKAGLITAEQARQSRFRNIITRSIGFEHDVDVDMAALQIYTNDAFLLCTDGLTTLVTDEEIKSVMAENYLNAVPQSLVDLANHRGGDDNITAIIVYVEQVLNSEENIGLKRIVFGVEDSDKTR